MFPRIMKRYLFWLLVLSGAKFSVRAQVNETQTENGRPGTTNWQITKAAFNREIEGYASLTSVNQGETISFFASTAESSYTLDVFRIGWYGGMGGRSMMSTVTRAGGIQGTPSPDPVT